MIARLIAVLALKERAKAAVHNAAETAAEAAIRIAIKLVAAVFLLIAFIYGTIALFFYLETLMEAWQAMGIVAAVVLVLGAVVLLLSGGGGGGGRSGHDDHGRSRGRPPAKAGDRRPAGRPQEAPSGDPMVALTQKGNELGVALHQRLRDNPEAVMAAAAAAGFLIGRSPSLRKLLLAGVSAALGAKARD